MARAWQPVWGPVRALSRCKASWGSWGKLGNQAFLSLMIPSPAVGQPGLVAVASVGQPGLAWLVVKD